MDRKKLLRVIGARPQIMQVKPLQLALSNAGFQIDLLHTGQHYSKELSDDFFKLLNIPSPDFNLEVGSGGHGKMTGRILEKFEEFLISSHYDGVIVDGDTNSTLGAALAAAKLDIPVFHVEAGTRDLDRRRPEEINRILTDHLAAINFAPIADALANLKKEGLGERAHYTGDVLLDNFIMHEKCIDQRNIARARYNLVTLHRPENTDIKSIQRLTSILRFLNDLTTPTIFPLHPRTAPCVNEIRKSVSLKNIEFIPPQNYFEFLSLINGSDIVITDSGGVPREASWLGKRCIMIFKTMTWVDLVNANLTEILTSEEEDLSEDLEKLYMSHRSRPDKAKARKMFGDGNASNEIAMHIKNFYR